MKIKVKTEEVDNTLPDSSSALDSSQEIDSFILSLSVKE